MTQCAGDKHTAREAGCLAIESGFAALGGGHIDALAAEPRGTAIADEGLQQVVRPRCAAGVDGAPLQEQRGLDFGAVATRAGLSWPPACHVAGFVAGL